MTEREACALLKQKFEAAGFDITENVMFEEADIRFEIDGWDAAARVGYEYVTEEAGDSWDIDAEVQKKLAAKGDLHVLVVDESAAPDAAALGKVADAFLATHASKPRKRPASPPKKPPAAKPATKKKPTKK